MRIFLILLFIFNLTTSAAYGFVILIDPGHGGSELGAVAKIKRVNSKGKSYTRQIFEKDLSLRLAKKVKKILDPDFTVYLTRSIDRKVTLQERAELADTVKADIFISIHFNASTSKNSHGFETFYLDNHQSKVISKVEAIENKDLEGEEKIINKILIDLVIAKTAPSSKKLGRFIHDQLDDNISKRFKMKNREMKPGLFYVLALSKRPGVLIEGGFMTNEAELKKLDSESYLDSYALGIANGIIEYHKTLPKKDVPLF